MRFSLRLALLLVAYLALVLAALAAPSNTLTLALWGTVLMALCYSTIVAATFPARSRCIAIGFAVASILFVAALYARPARTPWYGYFSSSMKPTELRRVEEYQRNLRSLQLQYTNPQRAAILQKQPAFFQKMNEDYRQALRLESANAVGVIAAGLIGSSLGALALLNHRECKEPDRPYPNSSTP